MIFGMSLADYTTLHVIISLVGIVSGFMVLTGWIYNMRLNFWTALFLLSTVLTSVTGFGFPFIDFLPSHLFGVLSLAALTLTTLSLYKFHLKGNWRKVHVITGAVALYLNVFVFIVQSFEKVPTLKDFAGNLTAPFLPFQLPVLLLFALLTFSALKKFRSKEILFPENQKPLSFKKAP